MLLGCTRLKPKQLGKFQRQSSRIFTAIYFRSCHYPLEKARNLLTQFSGIGPKTADVVLLFSAKKPSIPVDTHVNRVAKQLDFAPATGNYETVRKNLQHLYSPNHYIAVHVLFIAHGRRYCKARRPLCTQCTLKNRCPPKELKNHDNTV